MESNAVSASTAARTQHFVLQQPCFLGGLPSANASGFSCHCCLPRKAVFSQEKHFCLWECAALGDCSGWAWAHALYASKRHLWTKVSPLLRFLPLARPLSSGSVGTGSGIAHVWGNFINLFFLNVIWNAGSIVASQVLKATFQAKHEHENNLCSKYLIAFPVLHEPVLWIHFIAGPYTR